MPKAKKAYYTKYNRIQDYKIVQEMHKKNKASISFICKELGISRAAYYKWLNWEPTEKQLEDDRIVMQIKEIAESNNSLFGAMKMYYVLKNQYGFSCGHNRVYRLMCINDIQSVYRKKKSNSTYKPSSPEETAENILNRNFNVDRPNEKWCTDVTEIKIPGTQQKLFISPVLDLYDNYPITLEVSERNDAILANNALEKAHNKYPDSTPVYHSDRGFAYTRTAFKDLLQSYGMTQSMSRVSRCIDNGPCESFQGIFKDILFILYPDIKTKDEMLIAIEGTLNYYINSYPQKRFNGKTCGQVREQALSSNEPINYPIKKANKYIKYWNEIEEKKQRYINQIIESNNQQKL